MELNELNIQFSEDLSLEEVWAEWLDSDDYFVMVTPDNQVIMETKRVIYPGDQYLTADNLLYEVTEVDQDQHIAYTKLLEQVELAEHYFSISQLKQL